MNLKAGSQLQGGRYIIDKVLGQGGFGITYLGVQPVLDAKVAIKEFFMKEHCNRDDDTAQVTVGSVGSREMIKRFRQKFIKEARSIYRLKHRYIIPVIDVFEENGTAYYVMEYVGGGSLNDKVKEGALTEAAALRYIKQVAAALDFVHSKRMMHLDIKPANILLNENDEAVLIDFGLAKQYDDAGSQTSTTPVGISHGYAPLEQYKRGGVGTFSPATDIYSLGATLYKLLTGNTPPEAGDVNDDGLPALPPTISPAVRNAVETAMQPRRKERPQSISEFLSLLECHSELSEESLPSDDDAATVIADSATDKEILHSAQNDNDCKNSTSTLGGEVPQAEGCNPNRTPVISTERSDGEISNTDYGATVVADSATDNEILRSVQDDKERTANKLISSVNKKLLAIISVAAICVIAAFFGVKSYNDSKVKETEQARMEQQQQVEEQLRVEVSEGTRLPEEAEETAEKAAAEQAERERLAKEAAEKEVTEKAEQERLAAEQARKEEAERKAKEEAERKRKEEEARLAAEQKRKEEAERKRKEEYARTNGKINGHEYVDLGLPSGLKWATCNVGASKPEEYGGFYAWGETKEKSNYVWDTYKWCKGSNDTMTKYCTDRDYGKVDNNTVLDPEDDVAYVKWGSSWRMPTREEQDELRNNCTWTWTTQNGVNGYKVKSKKNGNSIFLPAAGYHIGTRFYYNGSEARYWSSSLNDNEYNNWEYHEDGYGFNAYLLHFDSGNYYCLDIFRNLGCSVRPVSE